jgi:mono/diheme cytochrome c family protein
MRHHVSVLALLGIVGCGSNYGPEGEMVKPGTGVQGVPGNGYGVNASRAVPVSGGTLLITADGQTAIAADSDRDRVFIANLETRQVRAVALESGDEPGRVVEDGAGRAHVVARSGGAVVSIDVAAGSVVARRPVCSSPRGIAYDPVTDLVHVACQSGELASFPAAGGDAVRVLRLDRDLRDVVVQGDQLVVSRFKSAQLLVVGANGAVIGTTRPPKGGTAFGQETGFDASTAWRIAVTPGGKVAMLHQRGNPGPIGIGPSGYGAGPNPCGGGIVEGTVSTLSLPSAGGPSPYGDQAGPAFSAMVGVSDFAVSKRGEIAIVSLGNAWFPTSFPEQDPNAPPMVQPVRKPRIAIVPPNTDPDPCGFPGQDAEIQGEPVAVAYRDDQIVVQSREPAQLQILGTRITIPLSIDSRADTGFALFHKDSGLGIACVSCHPEGMEDGRTWQFSDFGSRRTQNLGGGIINTAPFHWGGDLADFQALVHEVFETRMGSSRPNPQQLVAFSHWVDTVPAPKPALTDSAAIARGRDLFNSAATNCSSCHSGAKLTNNESRDVGTGGVFQVPSLIGVGSRAPFMHNGCATTLHERFSPSCGGGDLHGVTSTLNAAQIDDLVAYLDSL